MSGWLRERWNSSLKRLSATEQYWGLTPINLAMRNAVSGFLSAKQYHRVLDVGAGSLAFSSLLTPHCDQYFSMDMSATHPQLAVVGDGRQLPFATGSMDCILCSAVVEHTDNPTALMQEIARVLKPGGDVILTAPFLHQIHGEPHDYWRFTRHGLQVLLDNAKMNFDRVEYVVNGYVLALCYGLFVCVMGGLLLPVKRVEKPLLRLFHLLSKGVAAIDRIIGPKSLPAGHIVLCTGLDKDHS